MKPAMPSPRCVIVALLLLAAGSAQAEYKLVWSEEFDGPTLDAKNWQPAVHPGVVASAHEIGHYTDRPANVTIRDGRLVITARQEVYDLSRYTTGRVYSYGKRDFRYGRIEARVKLPAGEGVRARLRLLPTELEYGAWAASGEIDILDAAGDPPVLQSGLYYGGSGPNHEFTGNTFAGSGDANLADGFHVYGVEWQPYEMRWSVDGQVYAVQNRWQSAGAPYPAPFDRPFYLSVDLAVMKSAGPSPVSWPQETQVDWIHVHQAEGARPPAIEITGPADGAKLPANDAVAVTVRASDPDDNLAYVEFHDQHGLLGKVQDRPYTFNWQAADGCYVLVARAVDAGGFVCTDSITVERGIGCPPEPYHGQPSAIPGRIEAEDYDRSLKGGAYWDHDPENHGGSYRPDEGVDVQPCTEGGFNTAWMMDGEWMQYTVLVKEAGRYDIRCRVASPLVSARVHVQFDGVKKTETLAVPQTGDWQRYTDLVFPGVELKAGRQAMRFVVEVNGLNLNFIEITPSGG